ncbi:Internal alternative NAD(P)H-ubiquinone oxidoreductase A1 [Raphanus sativus]|nr:Internal alternative NAD(P)H-ubiquinone oxidoreductase A1 [Raphanus sativus]
MEVQDRLRQTCTSLRCEASTFGINGVSENAIFLREVHHAQEIRRKLLLNLMNSEVPGIGEDEKRRLLHIVVWEVVRPVRHSCYFDRGEGSILSSFDDGLRQYAIKQLNKSGVKLVLWSTGVGPSSFVRSLDLPKDPGGRIGIDEWMRVPSVQDVFAIGDCSGYLESTGKSTLPALAQVAEREGKYLANLLNVMGKAGGGRAWSAKETGTRRTEGKGISMAGFVSWFIWSLLI